MSILRDTVVPCCENCRFFTGSQCHRHAPAAPLNEFREGIWPRVYPHQWCGDHERKEEK